MTKSEALRGQDALVFNSALETGTRSVVILTACYPSELTLEELVALDHLIVHTGDVDGPPSLHPPEQTRAAELLVRGSVVERGLLLMGLKGLVTQRATPTGFRYRAGTDAGNFLDLLKSGYARSLIKRGYWLAGNIVGDKSISLDELVNRRLQESLLAGPSNLEFG